MGDVQRIFYYHLPHAWVAFLLFFVNFLASIWYLVRRTERADALALASRRGGRGLLHRGAGDRSLVGASGVGHLVDLGCAPHQHARALAHLRQLPGPAALRHRRADAGAGGGAGYLRIRRRSHRLSVDPLLPHAASAAGDRRRRRLRDSIRACGSPCSGTWRAFSRSRSCWSGCDTAWRWQENALEEAHADRALDNLEQMPPPRNASRGLAGDAVASTQAGQSPESHSALK